MNRTDVNPWPWSLQFGYSQATLVTDMKSQLVGSGQCAVDSDGNPQHVGDVRGQMSLALDNLGKVLQTASMGFEHVVHIRIYATDVDEAMKHFDLFATRFMPVDVTSSMTVLGVTRLALPPFLVEIEATAAR